MNNNEELKPCPFCGGEAMFKIHEDSCDPNGWSSVVRCKDCHIEVWGDEDEAINKWNRRVCVKQNSETLDTNSVASSGINTKLTYADIKKMVKAKWYSFDSNTQIELAKIAAAALGVERSGE